MAKNKYFNVVGVGEAAGAASMVAQTISNIIDQGKRRKFEQTLATLSNKQINELNQKMMQAQNEQARLQILSDSMIEYAKANEESAERTKIFMYIVAGALVVSMLVVAVIFKLKQKKSS